MKRNYIAPSTEAATWASMGLMQDPYVGMSSTSSGPSTTNNMEAIE